MSIQKDACAVTVEVDGRQKYLFETDKLQEMLGASRIIAGTVEEARRLFPGASCDDLPKLFSPVSGEIRAWASIGKKAALLDAAWKLREWLEARGVPHSVAYLETWRAHFENAGSHTSKLTFDSQGEPVDPGPGNPDLSWVHQALGDKIRRRKEAKSGEDARPRCSLFDSCRMHGLDPATGWFPDSGTRGEFSPPIEADEQRRQLVGWRTMAKREAWWQSRRELYASLAKAILVAVAESAAKEGKEPPEQLVETAYRTADEWAKSWSQKFERFKTERLLEGGDSYIAYACGDGDGMGDLLTSLHWNDPGWGDIRKPWERNEKFSREFDHLLHQSFDEAARSTTGWAFSEEELRKGAVEQAYRWRGKQPTEADVRELIEKVVMKHPPLLPQLLGGDDFWIVGEKEAVLEVSGAFISAYEKNAKEAAGFETLRKSLTIANTRQTGNDKRPLLFTVSMGITFAKAGHPVHDTIRVAEGLMASAKRLRKGQVPSTRRAPTPPIGCLDWHWVESSRGENVEAVRRRAFMYRGSRGEAMLLTTRPWTHTETADFVAAATSFQGVPRRKREQLEQILRIGKTLGDLAWKSWWDGLGSRGQDAAKEAVQRLEDPWKPILAESPWVDLEAAKQEISEKVYATPFIDLLALQHVLGLEGETENEHPGVRAKEKA